MKKRILSVFTVMAMIIAMLPVGVAPASAAPTGTVHEVTNSDTFLAALKDARDGDTIRVADSVPIDFGFTVDYDGSNDSLIIDKELTIDGNNRPISFRPSGILLGKNVTFKNITLGLASNFRPAIMANGHTLILENVRRDPGARNINLFCGGLTGGNQGQKALQMQGNHGQIIIRGDIDLGPTGRIFAGSISTDGGNNRFEKPATVTFEASNTSGQISEIYACGAIQTATDNTDWFNYLEEIDPPCPYPGNFQVSGPVTFNLYQGKVGKVEGDTGVGGNLATVNYKGATNLNDNLVLSKIGSLNVESGNLQPLAGEAERHETTGANNLPKRTVTWTTLPGTSCFLSDRAPLAVANGATLGMQGLGNLTVGNFTGGGRLLMTGSQILTVAGAVSGSTTVGVGMFNSSGVSTGIVIPGSTYIDAPNSQDGDFRLAASRSDLELVRDASGVWTVAAKEDVILVNDFDLASGVVAENAGDLPWLPFQNVQFATNNSQNGIYQIDLEIRVKTSGDWVTASYDPDSQIYTDNTHNLEMSVTEQYNSEGLSIGTTDFKVPPVGIYYIEVTVPAASSGTGQPITRTATLTVVVADATGDIAIPVPAAKTGLVYNGQEQVGVPSGDGYELGGAVKATEPGTYTATATLDNTDGSYIWSDGATGVKNIPWTIDKLDRPGPDNMPIRPIGLGATAPTTYNGSDGTITGTNADMEYAKGDAGFTAGGTTCGDPATTGLAAGDYYVRYRETNHYKAGEAVLVTVPQARAAIDTISIDASSTYKTEYEVGDTLDVRGLTLIVTMTDGSKHPIPVGASWVSGFDAAIATAGTGKELTITYGGKTAIYRINVTQPTATVSSIAISADSTHKIQFTVGDPLDVVVAGLKITATMSDGSTKPVDVLANMVSGFDSNTAGTQTLTITYHGKTTTYEITVSLPVVVPDHIFVSSTGGKTSYQVGEPLNLEEWKLTVGMSDGSFQTVPVTDGMVSGFDNSTPGDKELTITYEGIEIKYTVSVVDVITDPGKVTGVKLNKTAMALTVGGTETLAATVIPDTAANKTVSWTSSNPTAATVDGSGRVIAVGAGAAVITVTTADGGYTASCAVTVTANGGGTGGGTGGVWPGWDDWNNWNGGGTGGGATTATETTRNPDSSTTTTVTNKTTGVVTQTTRWPDGRQEKTVTQANGSKQFDNKGADGTTASGAIAANGRMDGSAQVSGRAVADANGGPVELPLPNVPVAASSSAASTIKVELPNRAGADVAIPVSGANPGAVAVLVNPDGTETVIKKSVLVDGRLWVPLAGDATVKIVDNAKGFIDMGGHWSSDAMAFVTSRALFEGNDNGRFLPNDTMTRAMLVTVLHRLEDIPASAGVRFDDVAMGQWYTAAVSWAAENQIVEGYNGSFTPNNSVTREQIAAILYRYAKVTGVDTPERGSFAGFPDSDRTSGWAREAMSWAVGAGLFSGDDRGRLNPGGNATRAEVATLLMRFVEYMAK